MLLLAPSSSVVPVAGQPIAEHRMYLPLAAVVASGVGGLYFLAGRRTVVAGMVVALAVGLGWLTRCRNLEYRNALVVWRGVLEHAPDNSRAHYNLGFALERAGRLPEAIRHYETLVRLRPDFSPARTILGTALAQAGRLPEATGHFQAALQLKPDDDQAYNAWGFALAQAGRWPEAVGCYREALRLNPDFAEAHNNLGMVLAQAGQMMEATAQYREALRLRPDFSALPGRLPVCVPPCSPGRTAPAHRRAAP